MVHLGVDQSHGFHGNPVGEMETFLQRLPLCTKQTYDGGHPLSYWVGAMSLELGKSPLSVPLLNS